MQRSGPGQAVQVITMQADEKEGVGFVFCLNKRRVPTYICIYSYLTYYLLICLSLSESSEEEEDFPSATLETWRRRTNLTRIDTGALEAIC